MIADVRQESIDRLTFKRTKSPHVLDRAEGHRPRVVIGHPMLGRGGSESIVMWLIEALKEDCDVTIATTGGWDQPALNDFYGTHVQEEEVSVRIAPLSWPLQDHSVAALRGSIYQRFARRIAPEYDLRISAYNLTDWGLPAIHFLADFSWNKEIRNRIDPPSPGFIYADSLMRKVYLSLASAIGSPSGRNPLVEDHLIANSHWTAETVRQDCGVECFATIYPPVWSEFPNISWEKKENSFVMIGRIAPEKQVEKAISILNSVRGLGHSIKLHLCGQIEDNLYGRRIAGLCHEHSGWIIPEGRVTGERKASILSGCRYGIQARSAEPFGISVAEMAKAGAIVFASQKGGQAEILQNPDILFSSESDAITKIHRVLGSESLQSAIRLRLHDRSTHFSKSVFNSSIRQFLFPLMQQPGRHEHSIEAPNQ